MTKIIGVRFKSAGKMYYFDPLDLDIKRGMNVIVETSRGIEFGEVTLGIKEVESTAIVKPLKPVIRIATEEDTERYKMNREKEKEAYKICLEKIEQHKLDMKLIEVEYTFDGNKILFYFTADGRVDFRELVKDLASVFRTRIELRQIGVRDESKTLGSIGVCGRNLCCSQFLGEFMPVSIKMAKEQGLSLNPSKISGACGRLMCCLKYEQEVYEELIAESPRTGSVVDTPDGPGTVASVALLRGRVRIRFENGDEIGMKEYDVSDITEYKPGQKNNGKTDAEKRFEDKEPIQTLREEPAKEAKKNSPRRNAQNKNTRDKETGQKQKKETAVQGGSGEKNREKAPEQKNRPNRLRYYKKKGNRQNHNENR